MSYVSFITLEYPPEYGGIGRYVEAIHDAYRKEMIVVQPRSMRKQDILIDVADSDLSEIWVTHILPVGTFAWLRHRFDSTPYRVFLHGMDFDLGRRNIWKRWLTRRILHQAKQVIANSHALAQEVGQYCGRDVDVIHPPLPKLFHALIDQPIASNEQVTFLTVCRLVERKGIQRVLEALRHMPDASYTIVGDGPYRETLEGMICDYNMQERVTIMTDVDDAQLVKCYVEASVFVMPTIKSETDREGFGIVYLEAQACGLPVIASNQAGVREAVEDGKTALLVDESPESLLQAMQLLDSDTELCAFMGASGKAFVRSFVQAWEKELDCLYEA